MNIIEFKKDLDHYSNAQIRTLAKYYKIDASMNDLRWLLAINHASKSRMDVIDLRKKITPETLLQLQQDTLQSRDLHVITFNIAYEGFSGRPLRGGSNYVCRQPEDCERNVAAFIESVGSSMPLDFICFQEADALTLLKYSPILASMGNVQYAQPNSTILTTFYNKKYNIVANYSGDIVRGRPYQITIFDNVCVVNTQFPHSGECRCDGDVFKLLNDKIASRSDKDEILANIRDKRIIMMGDFNNKDFQLNNIVRKIDGKDYYIVNFLGVELYQKYNKMYTCCWNESRAFNYASYKTRVSDNERYDRVKRDDGMIFDHIFDSVRDSSAPEVLDITPVYGASDHIPLYAKLKPLRQEPQPQRPPRKQMDFAKELGLENIPSYRVKGAHVLPKMSVSTSPPTDDSPPPA